MNEYSVAQSQSLTMAQLQLQQQMNAWASINQYAYLLSPVQQGALQYTYASEQQLQMPQQALPAPYIPSVPDDTSYYTADEDSPQRIYNSTMVLPSLPAPPIQKSATQPAPHPPSSTSPTHRSGSMQCSPSTTSSSQLYSTQNNAIAIPTASPMPDYSLSPQEDDPYTYAIRNGLPPIPSPLPVQSRKAPSKKDKGASSTSSSATPVPIESRSEPIVPRGSAAWTPAKLYTTPIRRADPTITIPSLPEPAVPYTKTTPPVPEAPQSVSRAMASTTIPTQAMVDIEEDEEVQDDTPPKKRARTSNGKATNRDSGTTARQVRRKPADQVYIQTLEETVERLKRQLLEHGIAPLEVEGVSESHAMSLDSAKLMILAQGMDLIAVRSEAEQSKRENKQLIAAMNGTHVQPRLQHPTFPGSDAGRRASIDSTTSTVSLDSFSSNSTAASLSSSSASSFASTAPVTPPALGSAMPVCTPNSWYGGTWAQQPVSACRNDV